MNQRPAGLHDVRESVAALPGLGKAALACVVLAIVLLIAPLWDLGEAIIGPRPTIPAVNEEAEKTAERAAAFNAFVAQSKGRSLFYNPKAVASAPPPTPETTEPTDTRPRSYGGPAIVAMVFDEVWFADGKRLKVGGEESDDLRVVAIEPPWSAKIAWKGVEFPVNFFERNNVVFKDGVASSATDAPPNEPPAEEPEAPAEDPPAATPPATPPTVPPAPPPPGDQPQTPPATAPSSGTRNL